VFIAWVTLKAIKRQADLLKQQVEDARKANADNAETASRTLTSLESQATLMTRQADAMDNQLIEMREASKQSARHLGLTERPWVSPNAQIVSPLIADEEGVRITIRVEFANVGKSPASGVWGMPTLYLQHPSKPSVLDERKRLCKEAVARPVNPLGEMLFPNAIPPHGVNWNMRASAVEIAQACIIEGTNIGFYSVDIILCVSYRSTIDEAARHYTGVIYHLSRIDPSIPGLQAFRPEESVPMEQLRLQGGWPFGTIAE
jgi:hypothetical protein